MYCKTHHKYINGLNAKINHALNGCKYIENILQSVYGKNWLENAKINHEQNKHMGIL